LVVAGSEGRLDAGLDGPVLEALDGRIDLRLDVRRDHALAVVEGGEAYRVGGDVQRNGAALVGLAVDALNRICDGLGELLLRAHHGELGRVGRGDELVDVDAAGGDGGVARGRRPA